MISEAGSFNTSLRKIAFGSCSKQYKEQIFWKSIFLESPDLFIWEGDIIYPNCTSLECISSGYEETLRNADFQQFLQKTTSKIIGIWDDHDFGRNDGGKTYPHRRESQHLFLDFFNVSKDSPRRTQKGLYSSYTFRSPFEGKAVKIILLDTRYFRDDMNCWDLSQYRIPIVKSLLTALVRGTCVGLGMSRKHTGDILGEVQWEWLMNELSEKESKDLGLIHLNIVVSSYQVFNTVPFLESWGHFPKSKKKLFSIIRKTPSNVIFISGDVHFAQILGNKDCVLEVTSSGLTHSIADHPFILKIFRNLLYPLYRPKWDLPSEASKLILNRNYGVIELTQSNDTSQLNVFLKELDGTIRSSISQNISNGSKSYDCLSEMPEFSSSGLGKWAFSMFAFWFATILFRMFRKRR